MPLRLVASLMLMASLGGLAAQTPGPTGVISGRVTDRTLGPVPGVSVTLSGPDSLSRTAVSDASGTYRIDSVPPGRYTLWFSVAGFQTAALRDVTVPATSNGSADVTLLVDGGCEDCTSEQFRRGTTVLVRFETSMGTVEIAVSYQKAPLTSENFLKYVDAGLYNNGRFHRATRAENYVINLPNRPLLECIQAGINPDRRTEGFPPIPLERTSVTGLKHVVGTVSMARAPGADTATSDFFILLNDQPSLDFGGKRFDDAQGAAAFGRVVAGMDVVRRIQQQPVEVQRLTPPITITSAARVK
jgi:peptidyl-prolyl cis-trans isomerase A (cyclophilin A)